MALPTPECIPGPIPDKLDVIYEALFNIESGGSGSGLPPQAGHAGEFLTTDGATASWASVGGVTVFANDAARAAAVPSFVGEIGYQTDTASYYSATGVVAGSWAGQLALGEDGAAARILLYDVTGFRLLLGIAGISADRTQPFQDADGTIALSSNNLSFFSATTSAQLAGVLTDETGSGGGFVRATSPTIADPTLTGTLTISGAVAATIDYPLGATMQSSGSFGLTLALPLDFSGTTNNGLRVNNLTTAQKNALTPLAGNIVYDTTLTRLQGYDGGTWHSYARLDGDGFTGNITVAGTEIITSAAAAAFAVGRQGATNPVFTVIANVANVTTGWSMTGNAGSSGAVLTVTSDQASESGTIQAKGTSFLNLGNASGTRMRVADLALTTTLPLTLGNLTEGGATTATKKTKAVSSIADNTATAVLTVTIPNAAHSATLRVTLTGSLGAGGAIGANEATGSVSYDFSICRTAGVNAVTTISSAYGASASAVAGAATVTVTAAASAISGAVGASNTFTVNVTIARSGGSSSNHTCLVIAEIQNANTTGITIA